jgi:hypothetical protein
MAKIKNRPSERTLEIIKWEAEHQTAYLGLDQKSIDGLMDDLNRFPYETLDAKEEKKYS